MHKRFLVFICLFLFLFSKKLSAQDFQKGVDYLKNNFPEKALPIFFAETEKANGNRKAYLYLAVSCLQLQKYGDAIVWLQKGSTIDPSDQYLYAYNLGNAYYMQAAYDLALSSYQTAYNENPYYAPTLLNMANTYMNLGKQDEALARYKNYLSLAPMSEQRSAIQQMIALLQGEKDAKEAEALRIKAEEQARLEREKALLDSVNNALSGSDSAKSISAGSEDTIDYNEEEGNLE